jgi:hypothetical protein
MNDPAAIEYLARCHCGVLTARYRTTVQPADWSVRACQCSFCRAHASLTTSDPAGSLTFAVRGEARLQRYRFDSRTADFLICRDCGVYVGARCDTDHGAFGVLNVRTLRPPPAGLKDPLLIDLGPESVGERAARRSERWTPVSPGSL